MDDSAPFMRRPARMPPLVPAALAAVLGVTVDRTLSPWGTSTWAATSACLGLAALLATWPRCGLALVLASLGTIAAAWHHRCWSDLSPSDLARSVTEVSRPAWVRGVLLEVRGFRPGLGPGQSGVTRAVLSLVEAHGDQVWMPVSGRVLVVVEGDRSDLRAGTAVEAAGHLARVAGPLNPGEFDYRSHLQAEGIRLRLSVDDTTGVWESQGASAAARGPWWAGVRLLGDLRDWSQSRLERGLDQRAAPLAAALLLGKREGVDPDVNDAFARTGTTHLLAISGLHLQVLAGTLGWVLPLAGVRRRPTFASVALATVGYSLLVGLMPSVARSAAMTLCWCLAGLCDRPARPANTLALAALVTLGLNPSHLFDVGCQLSFLAVGAIAWLVVPVQACLRPASTPLDDLELRLAPSWRRWVGKGVRGAVEVLVISTVVWLSAVPLVVARFHLISPIGILLNVPLVPLTSLALLAAGASLGLSAFWAPLGAPAAWVCNHLLHWTESIVRWGAALPWGHAFVPAPPWWWVLAFYAGLVTTVAAWLGLWPGRKVLAGLTALLCPLGGLLIFAAGFRGPSADVLAVGHGLAITVTTGRGHAVVYDCGRMRDPSVGRRIVAPALWARGVWTIDSLFLSHPDADHYNGTLDVLDRIPVREVLVPPCFDADPAAAALLGEISRRGVPVRTVAAGWSRVVGPSSAPITLRALHPPPDWTAGTAVDNARSLVLELTARGRRCILTGDLEGPGLNVVADELARSGLPIDVLLSPHHGGRKANPPWFFDRFGPTSVVVSQRAPVPETVDVLEPLERAGYSVLRTWQRGAIHLPWSPSGIQPRGFLDRLDGESEAGWLGGWPGWRW